MKVIRCMFSCWKKAGSEKDKGQGAVSRMQPLPTRQRHDLLGRIEN